MWLLKEAPLLFAQAPRLPPTSKPEGRKPRLSRCFVMADALWNALDAFVTASAQVAQFLHADGALPPAADAAALLAAHPLPTILAAVVAAVQHGASARVRLGCDALNYIFSSWRALATFVDPAASLVPLLAVGAASPVTRVRAVVAAFLRRVASDAFSKPSAGVLSPDVFSPRAFVGAGPGAAAVPQTTTPLLGLLFTLLGDASTAVADTAATAFDALVSWIDATLALPVVEAAGPVEGSSGGVFAASPDAVADAVAPAVGTLLQAVCAGGAAALARAEDGAATGGDALLRRRNGGGLGGDDEEEEEEDGGEDAEEEEEEGTPGAAVVALRFLSCAANLASLPPGSSGSSAARRALTVAAGARAAAAAAAVRAAGLLDTWAAAATRGSISPGAFSLSSSHSAVEEEEGGDFLLQAAALELTPRLATTAPGLAFLVAGGAPSSSSSSPLTALLQLGGLDPSSSSSSSSSGFDAFLGVPACAALTDAYAGAAAGLAAARALGGDSSAAGLPAHEAAVTELGSRLLTGLVAAGVRVFARPGEDEAAAAAVAGCLANVLATGGPAAVAALVDTTAASLSSAISGGSVGSGSPSLLRAPLPPTFLRDWLELGVSSLPHVRAAVLAGVARVLAAGAAKLPAPASPSEAVETSAAVPYRLLAQALGSSCGRGTTVTSVCLSALSKPVPEPRLAALGLLKALVAWPHAPWGLQVVFGSAEAVAFLLDRSTESSGEGKVAKHDVIEAAVANPLTPGTLGGLLTSTLREVAAQGPYYTGRAAPAVLTA